MMVFGLFEPCVSPSGRASCNLTPADVAFTMALAYGGKRGAVVAAIGITGQFVHTVLAALACRSLAIPSPLMPSAIGRGLSAVSGVQAWTQAGSLTKSEGASSMRKAMTQGFLTNILNPKVGLFILPSCRSSQTPKTAPSGCRCSSLAVCLQLQEL